MRTVRFPLSPEMSSVGVGELPGVEMSPDIPVVEVEIPDPGFLNTFIEFIHEFHAREGAALTEVGLPPAVYLMTLLAIRELAYPGTKDLPGVVLDEFHFHGVRVICVSDMFARIVGRSILKHAWLEEKDRKERRAACEALFAAVGPKPPEAERPASAFQKQNMN